MRIALTLVLTFSCFRGIACLQEYRTRLDGEVIYSDGMSMVPHGHDWWGENTKLLTRDLDEADSIYRKTGLLKDYSDYGVQLIYSNRLAEAKKVFQEIERRYPSLYNTAANLGTTYELLGQNDSALYWIRKAIKINPSSHNGSEWIHVKILEAKIAAKGDAGYFGKHSILGVDFGQAVVPDSPRHPHLDSLGYQIYYQLCERMTFVKPKDPIVAQLLFDLGNATAITMEVKTAIENYQLAKKYGFASEVMDGRVEYFERLQVKAETHGDDMQARENVARSKSASLSRRISGRRRLYLYYAVPIGVVVLIVSAYLVRKKRQQKA